MLAGLIYIIPIFRSSSPEGLCKKGILKCFTNFTRKQSLFFHKFAHWGSQICLLKESGTGVFYEFCEFFNTVFYRALPVPPSDCYNCSGAFLYISKMYLNCMLFLGYWQKNKFSTTDVFNKCEQSCSYLRIYSHFLKPVNFDRVMKTALRRIMFSLILDINECEAGGKNICHVKANCYNTIGSYYCQCNPGWKGNGTDCESELKSF